MSEQGRAAAPAGIYDIPFEDRDGRPATLRPYAGQVLLIVNTATRCGFTPQYAGLQQLQDSYGARGFQVIDFPCNQFGGQAPGSMDEIDSFCAVNFSTSFPRFGKLNVNGRHEAPLYARLKDARPGALGRAVKWNFTKFLIDREGHVIARYAPADKPEDIARDIEALL